MPVAGHAALAPFGKTIGVDSDGPASCARRRPPSSANAAPERLQHPEADGESGLSCTHLFIRAAPCRVKATGCGWSIKAGIKLCDICSRAPYRGLQPRSPPTPGTLVSVWQSACSLQDVDSPARGFFFPSRPQLTLEMNQQYKRFRSR